MKRLTVVAAAVTLALAGLVACNSPQDQVTPTASPATSAAQTPTQQASETTPAAPSTSPSTAIPSIEPNPEADAFALEQLKWTDSGDQAPVLEFVPPLGVTGPTVRLVEDGDGAEIKPGDSVTFDYAMYAGDNGQMAYSTYDDGKPQTISVHDSGMSQIFADTLIGHHVGAKIIFATIDSSQTYASKNLITMFMAVTVKATRTPLQRAEGKAVDPPAYLPKVTLAANGEPSIDLPTGRAAPHELISQDLIKGSGAVLAKDQTAVVTFSAWLWDSGQQFDSTWADAASMAWRMIDGEAMPGLLQGLVGKTVGSQVLLVIPPSLGFGDLEQETIPANSTLVYVIDLLDAQ